jgi:hypothetical protein
VVVETPIDNPSAYNAVSIDGVDTPGICTIGSGGVRKTKIDEQISPMQAGSFSVTRGLELVNVDYDIRVWTNEQYRELQALAGRLAAAQEARPPRQLRLVDLAVAHLRMKGAEIAWVGPIKMPKTGTWTFSFGFKEWKKRKPIGGVARPKDWIDREQEATRIERAGLEAQIKTHDVARSRGI